MLRVASQIDVRLRVVMPSDIMTRVILESVGAPGFEF